MTATTIADMHKAHGARPDRHCASCASLASITHVSQGTRETRLLCLVASKDTNPPTVWARSWPACGAYRLID